MNCQFVPLRVAHDASFANILAASLKLRLDENHRLHQAWRRGQNSRKHKRRRNEGDVDDEKRCFFSLVVRRQRSGLEQARVGPLK